jgi:uncharacterized Zn-binding protein involved in type VI secretion
MQHILVDELTETVIRKYRKIPYWREGDKVLCPGRPGRPKKFRTIGEAKKHIESNYKKLRR